MPYNNVTCSLEGNFEHRILYIYIIIIVIIITCISGLKNYDLFTTIDFYVRAFEADVATTQRRVVECQTCAGSAIVQFTI